MATGLQALREFDARKPQDEPEAIPSPAKVQATAAEIRRSWTPRQRRRRAQLARDMLWRQLLAKAGLLRPDDRHPAGRLTPTFPRSRSRRSPR